MTLALTLYVLIWPVIVAVTLAVLIRAFVKDAREAKSKGEQII